MFFPLLLAFFLAAFPSLACAAPSAGSSSYREQLLLRPLPNNALLASFNFNSNSSSRSFDEQNFRFFPRSLGQILQHAHTKELHLRFSLGRWDDESWGSRPWHGAREGGTGVELWAWVEASDDEEANAHWRTLTNALSGLFCASMNFIDSTKTIRPVMAFEPEGVHPKNALEKMQLLHGTLPHEVVCTENLTPFLKLLPCNGKAGVSSLLDGHKLFDAAWQTMSIDVVPKCIGDAECILEMEQTVDMVLDIARSKRPRDNPIPRPVDITEIECDESKSYHAEDSCFPLQRSTEPAWSLTEVFGRAIKGSCQVPGNSAARDDVCINVPSDRNIEVQSTSITPTRQMDELSCFELPEGAEWDVSLAEHALDRAANLERPRFHATRSMNGYGQERGSIQATISNPSLNSSIELVYLESLPWYMKPYIHTLKTSLSGMDAPPLSNAVKDIFYRPALDRHRGTHLELLLTVPPASTLTLSYDFDKAILRYTEYPPDANRGFDVAPAVIRLLSSSASPNSKDTYVRTTSLLLPLPTPDFSMPYNVIILTSTVMALGFGSIFNLLVRTLVAADEVGPSPIGLAVLQARETLRTAVRRLHSSWQARPVSDKKMQ